jgi:gliding motility-associated-like protein
MGEYVLGSIKENIYYSEFTFPGPGYYLIRYFDVARWETIVNMDNPGSEAFFVESTILVAPAVGLENGPQFLNRPLDFACTGKRWEHNPGGYDPDGDSLSYSLVPCRQYNPPVVPSPIPCTGYTSPEILGGGSFYQDARTGLITWDAPMVAGAYNIAFKVEEYRKGVRIGFAFRDMVVFVEPCDNDPPIIESISDTCVQAGDTLRFPFRAYDQNFFTDSIYFDLDNGSGVYNGPFSVPVSPATIHFIPPATLPVEAYQDTLEGYIEWITVCDHIRSAFYQIDFYAHDNWEYFGTPGTTMLSDHQIVTITVVAPPVTGLVATPGSGEIVLTWDPYPCPNINGYNIYRVVGGSSWEQDSICCDQSPLSAGFTLIGTTAHHDSVTFVDDNNGAGFFFGTPVCYVVTAILEDQSESCASHVACTTVNRDNAALTQDSVEVTDAVAGTILVSWAKPEDSLLLSYPTPWTYTLLRATGMSAAGTYTPILSGLSITDTIQTDTGLNTADLKYWYRVDLYDGTNNLISDGNTGSSIYLTLVPGDKEMRLNWTCTVPWTNDEFFIYRADVFGGPYVLIDSVPGVFYTYLDNDSLVNFEDYCYYVLSRGAYTVSGLMNPIWNASQKTCDYPRDFTPPCLTEEILDTASSCIDFTVVFNWIKADSNCAGDLDHYNFWFAGSENGPFTQVASVNDTVGTYTFAGLSSIADCFGISAVDTNGNESEKIVYCFDNCPEIEIGNVFTPNGDGINDYFFPIRDRSVKIREVMIYDRWGKTVYVSDEVDITRVWDGTTTGGKQAPDGVYFYHIWFDEIRPPGEFLRPALTGHVTLLR